MTTLTKAKLALAIVVSVFVSGPAASITAQTETPPAPAAPKTSAIPGVQEKVLGNGLRVAVVERRAVPIVTVQLLVKSGAASESAEKAGLANLTASMLTKGTKTRTATQIANEIEFLGGAIGNGAGWNNSIVSVTVTSDKLEQAMAILADVALNPGFDNKELELLKSQALDGLTFSLKQPGFLGNFVASKYSYNEHPAGGTPASLASITRADVVTFHSANYKPDASVLIFAGDIAADRAANLSEKFFGAWPRGASPNAKGTGTKYSTPASTGKIINRILVVDLPDSGQASVTFARPIGGVGRSDSKYAAASVLNSVLGGGYSSRLNQEIRIKRGLSYGAGSSFGWRGDRTNFSTRTQTKNESAAEVTELVIAELNRLATGSIGETELVPRKSVLTGGFGRNLETTAGLAAALGDLYSFGLPAAELNSYVASVNNVKDAEIGAFAKANLNSGDIIIVGDYAKFKDDLAKRFPGVKVDVVKAADLDISKENLRK